MSLFSFIKKNKESYSLVFDIGSGSISGGIVRFTEKAGVQMIHYAKEIIPFQEQISIPKHLQLMKSTLTGLASKIRTEGLSKIISKKNNIIIDRVFYVFSSPWSDSQTKTIKIKESKPFKVTEAYLNKLIIEQEKQFQIDISKSGKIIERKIIQLKINGYEVTDFYNKSTKDLEVSVFFTVVPEDILKIVDDAVSKTFNIKSVWCHSLSLSIFSVIRDLFPQKEDFIHIDVSEEMTDISIIKDNIVASTASLPLGRNDFIRELSAVLKVTESIADSMIKMHTTQSNDQFASLKLSVAMDQAAQNWITKMYEVIDSFREKIFVSDTIFLIAHNDLTPFLKDKLQKRDFKVLLIDNKKIKPPMVGDDVVFKLELMFLDNLYKI
jgi:cell division ATPase FtsA